MSTMPYISRRNYGGDVIVYDGDDDDEDDNDIYFQFIYHSVFLWCRNIEFHSKFSEKNDMLLINIYNHTRVLCKIISDTNKMSSNI